MSYQFLEAKFNTSLRLNSLFKKIVVNYIESCHLEDGGYFFARIPPSSGLDTYFAVNGLSLLSAKPESPETIEGFVVNGLRKGALTGLTGAFISVAILNELGKVTEDVEHYALNQIANAHDRREGFEIVEDIYIEVSSELETTYRTVWLLTTIGAALDKQGVTAFTLGLLNEDGGYGRNEHSTLASTFYATGIHNLLGVNGSNRAGTRDYLRKREKKGQVQFIEDLFWLIGSMTNLGEQTNMPEETARFVLECQRQGGGFARSPVIGIPTLEYTFYALSILRRLGVAYNVDSLTKA